MPGSEHGLRRPAGISEVPHSRFHHGRFGRLFRNLDPVEHDEKALSALAATMVDDREPPVPEGGWRGQEPSPDRGDNPGIPAGYTYLGQFIDHDLTFDPASSLLRAGDPDALHNFRTPRFDLDSLYGEGPADEPFMYDQADAGKLLVGRVGETEELDLPRNRPDGRALIGDPRNDENVIVSQLQLLFIRAHNKLVDQLEGNFEEARRQLRWHYQWVVVQDFLRRIVGDEVLEDIFGEESFAHGPDEESSQPKVKLRFYGYSDQPFMPVEFSVGAYRFGHSMVRASYDLNTDITDRPIFDSAAGPGDGGDLRGFQPLLEGWTIQWADFFATGDQAPQASRLIDTKLVGGLFALPFGGDHPSLAERNLLRGTALGLPSGQAVARRIGVAPLTPDEVAIGALGLDGVDESQIDALGSRTPLWYYVLREAAVKREGLRLGPVGARIVAETLVGLLDADPFSYLNVEPGWSPSTVGQMGQAGERFEMADLVRFADA